MSDISRRDFLKLTSAAILTASGLLGLEGLFRFLNTQTEPLPPTEFDLGQASIYPAGSRTVFPDIPAILLHAQSGFSAISLVCTHLGCSVESKPEGFICPCHGSRFDPQGIVTRGPANKPLRSLRVEVTPDNKLMLYTS